MSFSVLIIGNINSPLLDEFVIQLNTNLSIDRIDIISTEKPKRPHFKYNSIVANNLNEPYGFIPFGNSIYKYLKLKRILKRKEFKYQVCHIHGVNFIYSFLLNEIRKISEKIITTYWGSDFYRVSNRKRKLQEKIVKRSDFVTTGNSQLMNQIITQFKMESDSEKMKLCRFGLTPLDYIKQKAKSSRLDHFKTLDLEVYDLVITCGYNASPKQNHEEVIKSILDVKNGLPDKTILLLPMTYGGPSDYIDQIKKLCETPEIDIVIFDRYLDNEKLASLRLVSDIMIHVQPTDSFAGSMQEHIFAANYTIVGSWLPYQILKDNHIYYKEVDSIDELGKAIQDYLNRRDYHTQKLQNNSEIIYRLSSWKHVIQSWIHLYN